MRMIEVLVSDCCGAHIVDDIAGIEMCLECWEHCEVIVESYAEAE